MKAGIGEMRTTIPRIQLTPNSRTIIVPRVRMVCSRPNAVAIISTGRLMESFCARRSRS